MFVLLHLLRLRQPSKIKIFQNLVFLRFTKTQSFFFCWDFLRILYKEAFIVITPFKTGTSFIAALHYFVKVINPIKKYK